jgi:GT2 family glycosyltransferase
MRSTPFWSVMVPVYNRTEYLAETLRSVLAQDAGADEMQVAVVDDGSDEADPADVIAANGMAGRVELIRTPHEGIGPAFNKCIEYSFGRWIQVLGSDDIVLPGYYERLASGLRANTEAGMACCGATSVDERDQRVRYWPRLQARAGFLSEAVMEQLFVRDPVACSSVAVNRLTYKEVGRFRTDLPYALDWEMWRRIGLRFPIWYEPQVLCCYRAHRKSVTGSSTGTFVFNDVRKSIEIVSQYVPRSKANLSQRAVSRCAFDGMVHSAKLLISGNAGESWRLARAAVGTLTLSVAGTPSAGRLRLAAWWPMFFIQRFAAGLSAWWFLARKRA